MITDLSLVIGLNIAANALLMLVCLYIWKAAGQRCVFLWALSWGAASLRFMLEYARHASGSDGLTPVINLVVALSWALLCHGLAESRRVKGFHPALAYSVPLLAALAVLSGDFHDSSAFTILVFVMMGLGQIVMGVDFLRLYPETRRTEHVALGIVMICWGIHRFNYPWIHTGSLAPYGYMLSSILAAAVALLLMAITLRDYQGRFETLRQYARDPILFLTPTGNVIEANHAALEAYGYTQEEFRGLNVSDIRPHDPKNIMESQLDTANRSGLLFEAVHLRKDGSTFPVEVSSRGATMGGQRVLVSIIRDISERKQAEVNLLHASLHDPLTGLYNRAYFAMESGRLDADGSKGVGLILLDVDSLKLVNDTLGHAAGDTLLKEAADMLRDASPANALPARLGGDEFAIILYDTTESQVALLCDRLRERLDSHSPGDPRLTLRLSMGYSVRTSTARTMDAVYKDADFGLYRDKVHRGSDSKAAIIKTLVDILGARDNDTRQHTDRIRAYVSWLGTALGMREQQVSELTLFARFHDIGKVGIPDRILLKEGPLTPEERREMQKHSEIGYRIAVLSPELRPIADWIRHHHEWWNGAGYPMGLEGERIPLEARILAISDSYDAMVSDRPYRKAMPHEAAISELERYAGTQFDPGLVGMFIPLVERIRMVN